MIRIFFKYENNIVQLPINPEKLEIEMKADIKSIETVGIGDISLIKGQKLRSLKISSFLPSDNKYPFILTKGDFKEPKFYIDFFSKIISDKKPCRLVITDTEINMLMSIESFNHNYQGGDDDVYFDIDLQEYKEHRIKVLSSSSANNNTSNSNLYTNITSNRPVDRYIPKTYTVVKGDNLWNIAKKYLGDGRKYTEIYKMNQDVIKNPSLIYPGQVLKMPI